MTQKNLIYPHFDNMLRKEDKENLLHQKAIMIWFTGLSGSGKSTLGIALEKALHQMGFLCTLLDGDNIRGGINNNLTFTPQDRTENIRRIAEIGKLFIDTGVITIAAFISPQKEMRELAASIIGKENFLEIFISTPIEVCEDRDVKGLYAKARHGEIPNFTGISAPYEAPKKPLISIDTSLLSIEKCTALLLQKIIPIITIKSQTDGRKV